MKLSRPPGRERSSRSPGPGSPRASAAETLTNTAGQTLDVEVRRQAGPNDEQEVSIIADYWKAVGINARILVIPAARIRDNEFISSFPGTFVNARTIAPDNFVFTSDNVPTQELRWAGSNRGSFLDPEVDRLHNLVLTSLDPQARRHATIALHKRMSETLGIGPMYYEVEVILARNNVRGPVGNYGPQQGISWNVFEWELIE